MPTYSIQAPNGSTYQIDGPDGATDDQVRAEVLKQHPDAESAPASLSKYTGPALDPRAPASSGVPQEQLRGFGVDIPKGLAMTAAGVPEAVAHTVTGALAFPVQGAVSAYQLATSPKGRGVANANTAMDSVANAMVYQPRSEGGRAISQATDATLGAPGYVADAAGMKVADLTGSAGAGAATSLGLQALPVAFGARAGAGAVAKGAGATADAIKGAVGAQARSPEVVATTGRVLDAGYKLTPSQAGGVVGQVAEGVSGGARLERKLSVKNAPLTDALAKKEIGASEDMPLTPDGFANLRKGPNGAYAAMSKLGQVEGGDAFKSAVADITDRTGSGSFAADTPEAVTKLKEVYGNIDRFDAKDGVAKVRQLRSDAVKNLKSDDPERNALGYAQRKVADAIDDAMERQAVAVGQPELASSYKAARVQLAKIHTVEAATDANHVSASAIAKQRDRGTPVSGGLETIADAYDNFPRSVQDINKIRDNTPISVADSMFGAAGLGFHSPSMLAASAIRPITRSVLASDLYQNSLRRNLADSASAAVPEQVNALRPAATNALRLRVR